MKSIVGGIVGILALVLALALPVLYLRWCYRRAAQSDVAWAWLLPLVGWSSLVSLLLSYAFVAIGLSNAFEALDNAPDDQKSKLLSRSIRAAIDAGSWGFVLAVGLLLGSWLLARKLRSLER